MYAITDLGVKADVPGPTEVRAEDDFFPFATVCYRGMGASPPTDVVMSVDNVPVATEEVALESGNCVTIRPPGNPEAGPEVATPGWLAVYDDGAVVTTRGGHVELAVEIGDKREAVDIVIGPSRGRVNAPKSPIQD